MNCAAPPLVKRILILFFLVFPLFTLPVLAQEIDDSDLRAGSDPFPTLQISRPSEITVIPKFPKANTDVYIEIKNYSIDLNNSNITWRVNGVVKSQGKGVTTFSTKTGKNGELITVTASIRDEGGISLTETIRLRPAEIDLVWESDGYTPPFYRGKAAYTEGASVKVLAMPEFFSGSTKLSEKQMVYKWKINGKVDENQSGYGKRIFVVPAQKVPRPPVVEVEVSDSASGMNGYAKLTINAESPVIHFYEENSLYGTRYSQALDPETSLTLREIRVRAVPYFFSTRAASSQTLLYEWSLNGNPIPNKTDSTIIFRSEDESAGSSNIGVRIKHTNKIFQSETKSFTLKYSGSPNLFSR